MALNPIFENMSPVAKSVGALALKAGRRARDTLVGLKKTCRKLGILLLAVFDFSIARGWPNPPPPPPPPRYPM